MEYYFFRLLDLEWEVLYQSLKKFNKGENFLKWTKISMNSAKNKYKQNRMHIVRTT